METLTQAPPLLLFVAALLFAAFGVVSFMERERRASTVSFLLTVVFACSAAVFLWLPVDLPERFGLAVWTCVVAVLLYMIAGRRRRISPNGRPASRVDEREIMFARARLVPGSDEFERYYQDHPEHLESDNRFRRLPGLLSDGAVLAEPVAFASAKASFSEAESMREAVNGPVTPGKREITPEAATHELKRMALSGGAHNVGVTRVREYHVYSHVGRGTGTWGEPIEFEKWWALAFSVEMDHQTMRTAPAAPVVAESARRYVQAARIAVEMAELVRSWGYPARAHIDGNYRVIAPLVAADAGLGEIGRMGLLMTPRLGPRERLGVVTTALPLTPDRPGDDAAMLDFCTICRKCADNCPPRAIPSGDREPVDSGLRWKIDSDICFRYWSAVGTDCGRCMTVCPFSHPDNLAHNLVRGLVSASPGIRHPVLWADDLFYGRRPPAIEVGGVG